MAKRDEITLRIMDGPVLPWESQVVQYPRLGAPGVQYFPGDVGSAQPVQCLLWRGEDGLVHGILNRYPIDFPPYEKAGNVNVFVDPLWRRQGIASRLIAECQRMWGPIDLNQQRYTPAGVALVTHLLDQEDDRG